MKKIFSLFLALITISIGTPLSAQYFDIQKLQVPFMYPKNFLFDQISHNEEVENNIISKRVYET